MSSTNQNFDIQNLISANGPLRMVLKAQLRPVGDTDRFQPAGFPEIGHVVYKAPRKEGSVEEVCIVDSAASMANHLEAICRAAPHDPEAAPELAGMPYLRVVTDSGWPNAQIDQSKEVVVTSLTEGHRIASSFFLDDKGRLMLDGKPSQDSFGKVLRGELGVLELGKKAHVPPSAIWKMFATLFRYDPNALVHGVLFPQWQIKISRILTAHLEAFGAGRVERSGVKFDRLGKTTSGQPIFSVEDATANKIQATFILDLALLRSFGRKNAETTLGLGDNQKAFLLALALWKIGRLVRGPFRFRSGCDLECSDVEWNENDVKAALENIDIQEFLRDSGFKNPTITDVYWPANELYREASDGGNAQANSDGDDDTSESEEEAGE